MKKTIFGISFLIIATILCILCSSCKKETDKDAKGIIYGTVVDMATGEPVYNANVKLHPGGVTTLTGIDGSFQFDDVKDGQYTLSVSKNGYVSKTDDYVINVSDGKNVRRDIQISSAFESFKLTINGTDVDMIDFGGNTSYNQVSVSVVNNGSENVSIISIEASSDWIEIPWTYYHELQNISPNTGKSFNISINRSKLNIGNNSAYVYVSSGSLTKQLLVKATGIGSPVVSDPTVINIDYDASEALVSSSITGTGGGDIIDRGFIYSRYGPSYDYSDSTYISVGSGSGSFQYRVPTFGRDIYVRAYAKNGVHTGYSGWIWIDGNE